MFPRSVRSVGLVGFQPSSPRVCTLEAARSIPANSPRKPKCSLACSDEMEMTGTFKPRPMAVATVCS
jgi:hypothetical protein